MTVHNIRFFRDPTPIDDDLNIDYANLDEIDRLILSSPQADLELNVSELVDAINEVLEDVPVNHTLYMRRATQEHADELPLAPVNFLAVENIEIENEIPPEQRGDILRWVLMTDDEIIRAANALRRMRTEDMEDNDHSDYSSSEEDYERSIEDAVNNTNRRNNFTP